MKTFMEEYGLIVVAAIIIMIFVLVATPIGTSLKDGVRTTVDKFTSSMVADEGESGGSGSGSGSEGSSGELDMSTVSATLEENDWETIQKVVSAGKVAEAGWSVGDTKTLTINGAEQTATLIGLDHDGENTATFMIMSNINNGDGYVMNGSSESNIGGWEASEMRAWLNSDIYNNMSNKDYIKEVTKMTDNVGYSGQENEVTATSDKVFLLSVIETGLQDQAEGDFDYPYMDAIKAEGTTYEWFTNNSLRDFFWLRSPVSSGDNRFFCYGGNTLECDNAEVEDAVFAVFVIGE